MRWLRDWLFRLVMPDVQRYLIDFSTQTYLQINERLDNHDLARNRQLEDEVEKIRVELQEHRDFLSKAAEEIIVSMNQAHDELRASISTSLEFMQGEILRSVTEPIQKKAELIVEEVAAPMKNERRQMSIAQHQRFVQIENDLYARLAQFDGVRSQTNARITEEVEAFQRTIAEFQERFRRYNEALGRSNTFGGMPRI